MQKHCHDKALLTKLMALGFGCVGYTITFLIRIMPSMLEVENFFSFFIPIMVYIFVTLHSHLLSKKKCFNKDKGGSQRDKDSSPNLSFNGLKQREIELQEGSAVSHGIRRSF